MTDLEAKEILCKQLELLAEASKNCGPEDLRALSLAMATVYNSIRN